MAEAFTIVDIKIILNNLSNVVHSEKDRLTELDSKLGDGDLGLTMVKGFAGISQEIQGSEEKDIGKIFIRAGMVMARMAPSTMGTLLPQVL